MPALRNYDVFISHAWKYNDQYYKLTELLKEHPYFNFRNYSVPEHDPIEFDTTSDLYKQLEEQIRQSSVVLLIAGKYVKYRKWIQEEIKIAKKYNKSIIAIRPWGADMLPTEAETKADVIVNWQASSIVSAIREYSK
ncbi:MAG: TIR domain-containing protein [Bacilli bacterium]|nr:TIR domain-containing protein [Bacilli bacterium]